MSEQLWRFSEFGRRRASLQWFSRAGSNFLGPRPDTLATSFRWSSVPLRRGLCDIPPILAQKKGPEQLAPWAELPLISKIQLPPMTMMTLLLTYLFVLSALVVLAAQPFLLQQLPAVRTQTHPGRCRGVQKQAYDEGGGSAFFFVCNSSLTVFDDWWFGLGAPWRSGGGLRHVIPFSTR